MARLLVNEFISDNYKLKNRELMIIHGNGQNILKKEVDKVLKENKKVEEFGLDIYNSGCTLVKLVDNIDKNQKKCYNTQHNSGGGIK